MIKIHIEQRILNEAHYIVENYATVRETAKHFGISKSTVHTDVTERIKELDIDSKLRTDVRMVLDTNKSERHIRGGMATKRKYAIPLW